MNSRLLPGPILAALVLFWLVAGAFGALEEGLLAHLPMRTDLKDHSMAAHPVEVSGRVTLRKGAAWFEGKEDWLELPYIALNDRAFSVAVWLRPTGGNPTYGVLEQWDRSKNGRILHLMIRDGWRPWLGFYNNDVVSPLSLSNSGNWQHVVYAYDGTHQQIWINGRLICRRLAAPYRGTSGKTCIGKNPNWNNVPGGDFQGGMSDLRIYGRALSFEEIAALAGMRPADAPSPSLKAAAQPAGSVAPPGAGALPLLTISAGKMELRGEPGQTYVVEASANLQTWQVIGTLKLSEYGVVEFVDEDAALYTQRFYRLRFER